MSQPAELLMTQPAPSRPSVVPGVLLLTVPTVLPVVLLVVGLAVTSLALVYLSILASLLTLPCWGLGIYLLVRRSRSGQPAYH